jgi:hypothetical protein
MMKITKELNEFSDEELKEELERRELSKNKPTQNPNPDWSVVKENAEYYVNGLIEEGRPPKDMEHYIFESVINTLYGRNVWKDFINPILVKN